VYGKVFDQIYKSTVAECWQALVTFQQMIVLSDSDGVVDMTPSSISRTTNIPLEIIEEGIAKLEEKDPQSRSPLEDGRRIIRLDDHRDWGWRLVNHTYYRNLANREEKKEADRLRVADKRKNLSKNNNVAGCRKVSQPVADVAYTNTDTNTKDKSIGEAGASRPPSFIDQASEVLDFLNEKTGRKFQARTPAGKPTATADLVMSRLRDGYTVQQCRTMIARKVRKWTATDMADYLRPKTLFAKSNFENYMGECVDD